MIYKIEYSKFDETALTNDVQNSHRNFDNIIISEPNYIFDIFYSKLSPIIDKHAPLKQIGKKHTKYLLKPCIALGIKTSIIQVKTIYIKIC